MKNNTKLVVTLIGLSTLLYGCNSSSETTTVDEITPFGCSELDTLTIESASSDFDYESDYSPEKAIDDDLSIDSRWSTDGTGRSIILDLGSQNTVRSISTAWYKGDVRTAYFDIETSSDNNSWTNVLTGGSVSGTQDMITLDVTDSLAQYVKIIGQGNSATSLTSMIEVDVLGCGNTLDDDEPTTSIPTETTLIPEDITDGSIWALEGETPHPLVDSYTLEFVPLEAQIATSNGNGWRHEYKIDEQHRLPLGATYEKFQATYTVDMSDGAKSIITQFHGDSPTLMKLYYADSTEQFVDSDGNSVGDSVGANGIFDLYVRLRTKDLPDYGEDLFHFGTAEAGDTFDVTVLNNYGEVTVTAMDQSITRSLEETATDYLKFGNYLQSQVTTDETHLYGGDKCSALTPPLDFEECYEFLGVSKSTVTLTNVSYERVVDSDYELAAAEPNVELLNGDFESSLDEWSQDEPASGSGETYSGSGSAKITAEPGRFYQRVTVGANTDYVFSAYVKGEGSVGIKGTEKIDDTASDEIDLSSAFDVSDWTQVSITFTTGDDASAVYVFGKHGSNGDVRFDEFTLDSE